MIHFGSIRQPTVAALIALSIAALADERVHVDGSPMQLSRFEDTLCCACFKVDVCYRVWFAVLGRDSFVFAMHQLGNAVTSLQLCRRQGKTG